MTVAITIRPEQAADRDAVFTVHADAFPTDAEARLVDRLREQADPYLAWTAVAEGQAVGHVAFSPVEVVAESGASWSAMGLAPMAVATILQRRGIGARLVRTALEALDRSGHRTVFVLGHPGYYPRFGFVPAVEHGWSYAPGTEGSFFVRCASPSHHVPGTVRYHDVFDDL